MILYVFPLQYGGNWSKNIGVKNFITICKIDDQCKFDRWSRALKAGALGQPRGRGIQDGSTHVHPWLTHVAVWQKLPQYCKVMLSHFSVSVGHTSVMSDSVRPQRRQPTRLPRPWDSPGKNTGVGCHFLLQCMKVKRESEVAQSCPTPSNRMDCSSPGSSIHGIFQASVLEWGAIAFSDCRVIASN